MIFLAILSEQVLTLGQRKIGKVMENLLESHDWILKTQKRTNTATALSSNLTFSTSAKMLFTVYRRIITLLAQLERTFILKHFLEMKIPES